MSTIRTAADAIRTLVDALPERARSEWACDRGIVWAPRGTPIAQALAWRYDADRHAIGALIATVASPDVAAALADLLRRIDRFREVNDTIPLGAAIPVADMLRAADALAAAITHRQELT